MTTSEKVKPNVCPFWITACGGEPCLLCALLVKRLTQLKGADE